MTTSEANEKLMSDLKLVMHDTEELLKATAGEAGEKAKELRARLGRTLEEARSNFERLQVKAGKAAKATDGMIREHPYESIGVAFGVGLLVGLLIGRK